MLPNPVSTAGEAITLGEMAEKEGWDTATAVTSRTHTRRVRTMFEQCTDLDVVVVPTDHVNATEIPYLLSREILGYLKFWLTNPC